MRKRVRREEFNNLPNKVEISEHFHRRINKVQLAEEQSEEFDKGIRRIDFLCGRTMIRFTGPFYPHEMMDYRFKVEFRTP